jgi:tol-pal system protein YbgF
MSSAFRRCGVVALLGVGLLAAARPVAAQDIKPLLDRIDRLERDVNLLQRQVYRGTSPSGTPMAVSPPDSPSALSNEVRIGQIEDQMRTLTGQIEEIRYDIDQLKRRMDTLSSDVDQRFSALEHGAPAAAAAGQGAAKPAPAPQAGAAPPPAGTAEAANRPGVLGTLHSDTPPPPAPGQPQQQAAAAATAGTLPSGTPQEQYNYAFGLLRRADYPAAEQALKSFVQRYPNDALAGNAQYWLGETYFVRKDYENAATTFAVGYQKYPKSGKAADNLLKLGMALGSLGKKSEACSAFTRLDRDFPTAPSNIKDRETSERQQLGC